MGTAGGAAAGEALIRSYQPTDQRAVARLYEDGLLAGQIAENDTGADIDYIEDAYIKPRANHFWVAEVGEKVVGTIGVAKDGQAAQIRRLRVDPAHQGSAIPVRLIETALSHCQAKSFLKVIFDTRFVADKTLDIFNRCGFNHTRTRDIQGKELLEFYLDLYREPAPEQH